MTKCLPDSTAVLTFDKSWQSQNMKHFFLFLVHTVMEYNVKHEHAILAAFFFSSSNVSRTWRSAPFGFKTDSEFWRLCADWRTPGTFPLASCPLLMCWCTSWGSEQTWECWCSVPCPVCRRGTAASHFLSWSSQDCFCSLFPEELKKKKKKTSVSGFYTKK